MQTMIAAFYSSSGRQRQLQRLNRSFFPPDDRLIDLLDPLQQPVDWETVAEVALESPRSLQARDRARQRTPLCLAIERHAPPFVIRAFLRSYPQAAREVQKIGLTPLHLAVARGISSESVQVLLEAWPEAALHRMSDACVPLHYARNVDAARLLIEACPEAVWIANKAGYLPLHRAVLASYAAPEVVQLLVDVELKKIHERKLGQTAPSQLLAKTCLGISPLDAACELVDKDLIYRQGERTTGSIPIVCPRKWDKLAILARATHEAMLKLQQQKEFQGQSSSLADSSSPAAMPLSLDLPLLHILLTATSTEPPTSIIQHLLTHGHYPEQRAFFLQGRSALAIAVSLPKISNEVVNLLLSDEVVRATATVTDEEGRLPLHLATANGRMGLKKLVQAAPMALTVPDPITGMYPCMLAATFKYEDTKVIQAKQLDNIYSLLRETPSLIPRTAAADATALTATSSRECCRGSAVEMGPSATNIFLVAWRILVLWFLPVLVALLLHAIYHSTKV